MNLHEFLRGFDTPPVRFLPAPFWFLNDHLEPAEMRRQVRLMHEQEIGGFFMHARMGRRTPYLSEDWMQCIEAAVDEASRLGMQAWFYDEDNWPSGYAGGKVLELGDWTRGRFARAEFVEVRDREACGIPRFDGPIAAFEIKGSGDRTELLTRIDPEAVTADGRYRTVSPEAERLLVFCLELHRGEREFCPEEKVSGYVDVLNPEVTDAFIDSTYEAYRERLEPYFGGALTGAFFDEPQYHELGLWDGPPRFPWTGKLPELYRGRTGRDLTEDLPSLLFEIGDHAAVRYEYYRLLSELFSENFTARLAAWCEARGIRLTGHVILEEHPRQAVRCVGNPMMHYRHPHVPGIDHLGKDLDLAMYWSSSRVLCKQVQSAANQLGREQVMCETFAGGTNWFGIPDQKWMGDWMNALGVNLMCYHAFHYSMRGYRKRDYPPTFNYQQPWFPLSAPLGRHFGRLGYALSRGTRRAEVLVIHPIESVWATQRDDNYTGAGDFISDALVRITELLLRSGWDWDFGDESYLEDLGAVEDGALRVGGASYRIVIVPPGVTLRDRTIGLLEELLDRGGSVLRISPSPATVRGVPSERCAALMASIPNLGDWNRPDLGARLTAALGRITPPQVLLFPSPGPDAPEHNDLGALVFQERVLDGARLYFFATASKEPHTVTVELPVSGPVTLLDTASGTGTPYPHRSAEGKTVLTMEFEYGRSFLFLAGAGHAGTEHLSGPDPIAQSGLPGQRTVLAGPETPLRFGREQPNVLILDRCRLETAEEARELYTIESGRYLAEAARYNAPDRADESFRAVFGFRTEAPVSGGFLLMEGPERFTVELDGVTVTPGPRPAPADDDGWFVDRSLRKLPVPFTLMPGNHTVTVSARTGSDLELEPLYLAGGFGVYFDEEERPYIGPEPAALTPGSITGQGYPFYAGVIRYELPYEHRGGRCVLEAGDGKAVREIMVNGAPAGTLAWPPYELELTGLLSEGANTVTIRAATHLRNFYGPHHVVNEDSVDCFNPTDHLGGEDGLTGRYLHRPAGLTGEIAVRT